MEQFSYRPTLLDSDSSNRMKLDVSELSINLNIKINTSYTPFTILNIDKNKEISVVMIKWCIPLTIHVGEWQILIAHCGSNSKQRKLKKSLDAEETQNISNETQLIRQKKMCHLGMRTGCQTKTRKLEIVKIHYPHEFNS